MLPLLQSVADGQERRLRDLVEPLADTFNLTDDERAEMLPSRRSSVLRNRVNWARAYLKQAGLVESPARGSLLITTRGREVLADGPDRLTNDYLNRYSEFRDFRARSRQRNPDVEPPDKAGQTLSGDESATPEEQMGQSWRVLQEQLADELLSMVKTASPEFFDRLVVDLLVKMGYGGSHLDAAQVVGRSGDGGIDGVIKEDRLGLETIYVQAKRWERSVGSPDVQAFAGSLDGRRARKGVFMTTSSFTSEATTYVGQIEKKIVLIDGRRLVNLMIEHGVGVVKTDPYPIQRIANDYFEED